MKLTKKRWVWIAKLLVGLGLLGYVFLRVDWFDFSSRIQEISLPLFGILLICAVVDRSLMGVKWNLLLRANGMQIPLLRVICLYVISNFLGAFTPGNLGADAYRVMALSSFDKNAAVLSTVVLERAVGMLVQLIFVMAALPFSLALLGTEGPLVAWMAIIGSAGILSLIFLPVFPPLRRQVDRFFTDRPGRLFQKIHTFLSVFAEQQKNWRVLTVFFLLTFVETALFFYISYLVAKVGGLNVSLAFIFSIMPIVMFVLRLPISIQGLGLQEGLFAYSFSLAGNSIAQGILASLIWRLQDFVAVYLPGCLLFWFYPGSKTDTDDISPLTESLGD